MRRYQFSNYYKIYAFLRILSILIYVYTRYINNFIPNALQDYVLISEEYYSKTSIFNYDFFTTLSI